VGHEERFPLPRLSDRYGFSKETVARVPGSDRDAPKAATPIEPNQTGYLVIYDLSAVLFCA
jgi:hypothetical protein